MRIAVWYHCKISGPGIPDAGAALEIVAEQMEALKQSGLARSADAINIGLNGGDSDALLVASLAPEKSSLHVHGKSARWEFPTLFRLQASLSGPDSAVLYFHSKGVTRPNDPFHHHHRRTMEHYLIHEWRTCVRDLERGYDAVGINLVDPLLRPVFRNSARFYAGNFWWSRSSWLKCLPMINPKDPNRMDAEGWVFRCQERPLAMDYERPHLSDWCKEQIKP